uniref:Uncharacterized protein n=1 Tax=Arion vulgaris TaxID=1028688 RepID=A0A0B6Z708_9EUPU
MSTYLFCSWVPLKCLSNDIRLCLLQDMPDSSPFSHLDQSYHEFLSGSYVQVHSCLSLMSSQFENTSQTSVDKGLNLICIQLGDSSQT